jgi:hypothetical protein
VEESSEEGVVEELSTDDPKIDELQGSVVRLREFIQEVPAESTSFVPDCVEDYCDKMEQYRVKDADYVLLIA